MTRLFRKAKASIPFFTALIFFFGSMIPGFSSAMTQVQAADASAKAVVEEFEQTTNLYVSSVRAKSASIGLIGRPETIFYGYNAVKLSYDFTGTTGTSAAYVNFRDPDGSAGRTLQGVPKKLGVWVYGDGNNHWLRAQVKDASNVNTTVDITTSNGLNWSGWKYVTVSLPSTLKAPVKLNQLYVVETKDNNKNSGALYFDQLSAFYTDSTVYGLDLVGLSPMQTGESKQTVVFATYSNGTEPVALTSGVSFRSSNELVATVDASGRVQALQPGTAAITASYGNAPDGVYWLTVTAEAPVLQKLEVSAPQKLETGMTAKLRVYAAYNGATEPVQILSGAAFQSSAPNVAAVDATGQIQALKAGTAVISASYQGVSAQLALTVTNPVPVLQSIQLANLKAMTIGESKQAKVLATYTLLPEPVEITSGVTFTSSAPSVASIGPDGTVTALKVGGTRIMASYGGKTSDFYLMVNKVAAVPKTELRAAWIATVDNVDWPKKGVTDAEQQKQDYIQLLDELQASGMNAVVMQVKPTADAFYPSAYGPWSEWLTGVQGQDPGYNPLEFMLGEVHKRNMEFHAWFNPYRISLQDSLDKLVPNHPARLHPEWVVSYGGKLYFNPGIPEAKAFIIDSIMEVVKNYDIDAVHFDDYFYPYPVAGVDFPDDAAYAAYGAGFSNKADWRRHNVDAFVREVGTIIKQEKSYVKYGISPFGIWRNKSQDPAGSDTNGLSSYEAIYADTKKWVEQGWIDYVTPQIYWYLGYSPASYDKLVEWWSAVAAGRNVHLYSGQAVYRIDSSDPAWKNPEEMPNQVVYNRNFDAMRGSMYFSAKWLPANPLGFTDRLKGELYRYPALVPAMPWLDATAPAAPVLISAVRKAPGVELQWNGAAASDEAYYAVYRFEGPAAGSTQDATKLLATLRKHADAVQTYLDRTASEGQQYTYVITAVDRLHNESTASNGITMTNVLDTTAPVTTAAVEGTQRSGWFVSDVAVALTAADEGTGVALTEYSLDNSVSWTPYTGPIAVTKDGIHSVSFRSVDRAGNVEETKTVPVAIDRIPPTIQIIGAGVYQADQQVTIHCTAADTVSGLVYNPCGAPLVSAPAYQMELGAHEVFVQAADAAGNTATAQASYTIEVTEGSIVRLLQAFVSGSGESGIENSLLKKLEKGNMEPFIHEVHAQAGKGITLEQAEVLIRLAEALRN